MFRKHEQTTPDNLWNRLARNLVFDAKQVLLYAGIRVPEKRVKGEYVDYSDIVERIVERRSEIYYDPTTRRIHFEPDYVQNIIDRQSRFEFPVLDKAFGPGGIAGYIHKQSETDYELVDPRSDHIVRQALLAKSRKMPYAFVSARQLAKFEVEQFGIMTNIYEGPIFFHVSSKGGIEEAEKFHKNRGKIITNHSIFDSPLTLSYKENVIAFMDCVQRGIPVYLTTMPFSGQNGPMTPYGIALLAYAEFLAGMAIADGINRDCKVINGAYPTMCTPGKNAVLKLGSVTHNFVNYLVNYTSRVLDIPSIQSGCTIEGSMHREDTLGTDYQTVRAMILWEDLLDGWHMLRHTYGFLGDLAFFSFEKAEDDIAALRHIQSLDDAGVTAVLATNVRLNRDIQQAREIYEKPSMLFQREGGGVVHVIAEVMEIYRGDFGSHEHTLKNVPSTWF